MSNGSDNDTTYTISIEGKVITLTPSTGTAQTITLPDDLDTGFGAVGADGDKELKFVAQELVPSGTRNFSVTLASTGSEDEERRYSFVAGSGTGSIDATTDPGGIIRSVLYIPSSATVFTQNERRRFRFQFRESARKNRSLSGAKLVVNGTEHDVKDWGISSDRRYREVRTPERVTTYTYSSGRAVTLNLKFGDGTYLGHASVTKTTRTLLKEDVKGALGITDVRENVTSVLQDVTDATATTSGEAAVVVSVPFDFHTVYDDAGMSPQYDATAKWISFDGLSDSERTSVVVRSNVRLRHNGGECSVELSLREFRGAAESNRWVLARKNLDEHGTLFAFDLAGESAEAEISKGRRYRFDVDVKRSGEKNATAGVHGTSAHVINFASFERVEEDRAWSPTERLAWPPNQNTSVRLTSSTRSELKTTGYFFENLEAELFFSREWRGVIGAGSARVKFDVTYSGKSGSFRSPYDFRIAGSWVLSDGTATDWEEKLTVSVADASGSETLTLTPPTAAAGMYLRYVRETNTFTGSSDEITFAAGDVEISYVSGGSAVPDATTDVKGKVELATTGEATTGSDATRAVTPAGLKAATDALSIPSAPVDASVSARGIAEIATEGEADTGTDSGRIMTPALVARLIGAGRKGGTSLPAGPVAPNYFVLTARDGTNEPGLYACSENGTWTRAMSMVSSDKTLSGDGAGTKLGLSEAEKKRMDTSYDFLRGALLKASLTSGNNSDSSARGYADVAEGSTDGRNNVTFGSMDDATFTVGDDEYKVLRLEQATGGDRGVLVKFGLSSSGVLTPPALPGTLDLRIGAETLRQRDAAVSAPKDKTVNSDGSVKDSAYIEWKFASAPSGLIPAPASGAGGKVEIEMLGEEADADKVVPDATEMKKGKMEIASQDDVNALSDATKAVTPGRLPEATATQKGLVELADEAGADTGTDDKSAMTPALVKRRIDAFDTSGAAKIKDFGVPVTRTKKTSIAVADSDTFLIRAASGQTSKKVLYIEEGSEENYLDSVKAESRVFYGSKVYTIKTAERGAAVGGKSWAKFTMSEALSDVADDTSVTFYFTSRPLASSAELAKTTLSTQVNIADPGTVTTWTAWTDVLSWTAPSSGVFSFIGVFTSAMVNVPTGDRTWIELRVARTRGTATAEVLVVDKGRRVWLGSVPAAATLEWDFNLSALLDARANDVYKVQARFLSTQTSATRQLQFKTADNNFIWTLKQVAGEKGDKGDTGPGLTAAQTASLNELLTFEHALKNSNNLAPPETLRLRSGNAPARFSGKPKLPADRFDREVVATVGTSSHRFYVKDLESKGGVSTFETQLSDSNSVYWSDGAPRKKYRIGFHSGDRELLFSSDTPGDYRVALLDYEVDLEDFARKSSTENVPSRKLGNVPRAVYGRESLASDFVLNCPNQGEWYGWSDILTLTTAQAGVYFVNAVVSGSLNADNNGTRRAYELGIFRTRGAATVSVSVDKTVNRNIPANPDSLTANLAQSVSAVFDAAAGDVYKLRIRAAFSIGQTSPARTLTLRRTSVSNSNYLDYVKIGAATTGSGAGLTQAQVDARVAAGVSDWAEAGNTDQIPANKLENVSTVAHDEEILLEHDYDPPIIIRGGVELAAAQAFSRELAAADDGRTLLFEMAITQSTTEDDRPVCGEQAVRAGDYRSAANSAAHAGLRDSDFVFNIGNALDGTELVHISKGPNGRLRPGTFGPRYLSYIRVRLAAGVKGVKGDKGDPGSLTTSQVRGLITAQEGVESEHLKSLVIGLLTDVQRSEGPIRITTPAVNSPLRVGAGAFPTDGYVKIAIDAYDPMLVDGSQLAGLPAGAAGRAFGNDDHLSFVLKTKGSPTAYGVKVGRDASNFLLVSFDSDPPGSQAVTYQVLKAREDAASIIAAIEHAAGNNRLDIQALRGNPVIEYGNAVPGASGRKPGELFLSGADLHHLKPSVSVPTRHRNRVSVKAGNQGYSQYPIESGTSGDNYENFIMDADRQRLGTNGDSYYYQISLRADLMTIAGITVPRSGTTADVYQAGNEYFRVTGLPKAGNVSFYHTDSDHDQTIRWNAHNYIRFSSQPTTGTVSPDFTAGAEYDLDFITRLTTNTPLNFKPATTDVPSAWEKVRAGIGGFTDIGDTPGSYSGQKGKSVVVKNDETGVEFADKSSVDDVNVATLPDNYDLKAEDVNKAKLLRQDSVYTLHGESRRHRPNWYVQRRNALADRAAADITIGEDPNNSSERGWSRHADLGVYGELANEALMEGLESFAIYPAGGNESLLVRIRNEALPSSVPGTIYATVRWGSRDHSFTLTKDSQPAAVANSTLYKHNRPGSRGAYPDQANLAKGKNLKLKCYADSGKTKPIYWSPAYRNEEIVATVNVKRNIFDALPAVADYSEGDEVRVWRGSGGNRKPWTYTLTGSGAGGKWIKSAGSPVLLKSGADLNFTGSAVSIDMGFTIPAEFEQVSFLFLTARANMVFDHSFSRSLWMSVSASAVAGRGLNSAARLYFHEYFASTTVAYSLGRLAGSNNVLLQAQPSSVASPDTVDLKKYSFYGIS